MTAITSPIILKNESFINGESNIEREDRKYLNANERKCGEVILMANTKFWFVCTFCDGRFNSIVIFRSHIKDKHIKNEYNENDFHNEDPLDVPQNKEEFVVKLDADATAGNNNNQVHDDGTNNSCFISTQKFKEKIKDCSDFISKQSDDEIDENLETNESDISKREIEELKINEDIESEDSESYLIPLQKCKEIQYSSSDFNSEQSDNEIEENSEIKKNDVTKKMIKEFKLTEDVQSEHSESLSAKGDSKNATVFCRNKEDLPLLPIKIKKKRNRKKKVQSCSLCQHIAKNRNSLQDHMITQHGTGTRFQCEECGKCFRNGSNLKSHLVIHSGTRPYKCDFCDSGFSHPNSLKTHRYLHTGERPYKCNQCDKGFVSTSGLKIHKREHTGETPYVCQFCERGYANKCHYNRHIISHSNRKAYECKLCDKAFKHRETLSKHMVVHTSQKKEVCDVCQKQFIHKKNLVQHKKIHSSVKQYTCKICNKNFAQNAGLYSHMKYHKVKD